MVRILLVEDLALIRDSLAIALGATTGLELRCCSSVAEGIAFLERSGQWPGVVLLKYRGDGEPPDRLISLAHQNGLQGKVLVMTQDLSEGEVGRLIGLGTTVFSKHRPLAELVAAIHDLSGLETLPPAAGATHNVTLSNQEQRAAELVVEGLANKEIGARMGITESSVKSILQRVFLKTGMHSRAQIIRLFLQPAPLEPSAENSKPDSFGRVRAAGK